MVARSREVVGNLVVISPEVQQLTAELTPVVTEEPRRCASMDCEPIQHGDDMLAAKTPAYLNGHTRSRMHIDGSGGTKSAAIH